MSAKERNKVAYETEDEIADADRLSADMNIPIELNSMQLSEKDYETKKVLNIQVENKKL
jgi:hypothetical protein